MGAPASTEPRTAGTGRRRGLAWAVLWQLVLLVGVALPATAGAQSSPQAIGPWDGSNPFNCELQSVGTGTDFPDPEADPFCVEFDKANQNLTDFGLVEFLAQEPARVAAAVPKCFYYQHDHWTGSIVQSSEPELWNWIGSYFFDKAKGTGGVHVTDFRIAGQPFDATPYAPPEYHPYLEPTGGGGVILLLETNPDPTCVAMVDTPEKREQIYRSEPVWKRCAEPAGQVRGRRIGGFALGMSAAEARRRHGPPRGQKRGVRRWCLTGGSSLWVAFRKHGGAAGRASGGRVAALIRTTNPGHSVRRVGPGTRRGRAIRRLDLKPLIRRGPTRVLAAPSKRRRVLLAGMRGKRVRWLAIAEPRLMRSERRLRRALGGAR